MKNEVWLLLYILDLSTAWLLLSHLFSFQSFTLNDYLQISCSVRLSLIYDICKCLPTVTDETMFWRSFCIWRKVKSICQMYQWLIPRHSNYTLDMHAWNSFLLGSTELLFDRNLQQWYGCYFLQLRKELYPLLPLPVIVSHNQPLFCLY